MTPKLRTITLYPRKDRKDQKCISLAGIESFSYTYNAMGEEIIIIYYTHGKTESYTVSQYSLIKVEYW